MTIRTLTALIRRGFICFALFAFSIQQSQAQTYCLTYSFTLNGTTLDLTIGMIASGSPFKLGASNLQLKYKTAALTSPTLISNTLAPTGRYNGISVTQPTPPSFQVTGDGLVSFNFNFTGTLGTGYPIALTNTNLVVIRFDVLNSQIAPDFRPYNNGTAGTVVYNDDPNNPLLLDPTPNCFGSIPLEWLNFQARVATEKGLKTVYLGWSTASERDVKHFIVERSRDAKLFEKIGDFVQPYNTISKNTYNASDMQPLKDISFYRIRQIDNDGKETFSKVVSVFLEEQNRLVIYPNPVSSFLKINKTSKSEAINYQIFNLLGQELLNGILTQQIDVSFLPKGAYVLKTGAEQVKFMKE